MTILVHLMRHGTPELAGRLLGHLDAPPEPTDIGRCVERTRGLDFARVISSDLARARTLAAVIAAERAVPHDVDARWRELDFGAWEGADPAGLTAEDLGRFWDDPDGNPPPGGERWFDLCRRVGEALAVVTGPALIVTHAGAMRAALARIGGFDHRQGWAFDLPYGAVLSLKLWHGETVSGQIAALAP